LYGQQPGASRRLARQYPGVEQLSAPKRSEGGSDNPDGPSESQTYPGAAGTKTMTMLLFAASLREFFKSQGNPCLVSHRLISWQSLQMLYAQFSKKLKMQ